MKVALLTFEQSVELTGQLYSEDSYFNPILDGNTPPNWIISTIEVNNCINPNYLWVKELPLIDYVAPQPPITGSL